MLCYKQLLRPIIQYGFPCWSDISSHQMERVRRLERACLRVCTNTRRAADGKYSSNARLYQKAGISRIDRTLVNQAIKFLEKPHDDCDAIRRCLTLNDDALADRRITRHKPPWYIMHLKHTNQLLTADDKLLQYHKPANATRPNLVYNTNQ